MRSSLAAVASAILLGLSAPVAQAAPLGGAGQAVPAVSSEVVHVHGLHTSCKRDKHGWHRSHLWGRERCAPPHWRKHRHGKHHHHHHHGKKRH